MIFKQYYLGCLAHASYLIGDEATRTAAVVDPQRDIGQYLADAQRLGLEIRHVFLTHLHADFVAGHVELRERVGAQIHLGVRAKAEYEFAPLKDGSVVEFGSVRLVTLETPGHSPESVCLLVYDLKKSVRQPHAVLTGDTLFIGDVGRPDLRASLGWSAEQLASLLYDSLREKLLTLPDETLVYPAHGAGSLCGKNLSTDTVSTIGAQRKYNYALQPMSKEAFIGLVTSEQPDAPAYFTYDAILNTKERPTLDEALKRELKPLTLERVLQLRTDGAQILDVRDPSEFEAAHLVGSVNIGLCGKYATWAGTLLDREKSVVLVATSGSETEAALRLGRIGFDFVVGYLNGGMQAVEKFPEHIRRIERVTAATLDEQLHSSTPPFVLDVRNPKEYSEDGRIEGSVNIPLAHLKERAREIPRDRRIVVHCASGYRSTVGTSILISNGFTNVSNLVGGIEAWEASKLETVR